MRVRVLSIDTTSDFGSLALWETGEPVREIPLHSTDGFAHVLYDQIERLLNAAGWSLASVDCFAAASGPGSFTGVRVGLTAAKGLADVMGKPVVAASNLRAIASFGTGPLRAALLDARRGEVYGAVYDPAGVLVQDEVVMKFPEWREQLPPGVEFVSQTPGLFQPYGSPEWLWTEAPRALGAAIGRIAAEAFAAGLARDPLAVDANYVRRSDAELFWKDAPGPTVFS